MRVLFAANDMKGLGIKNWLLFGVFVRSCSMDSSSGAGDPAAVDPSAIPAELVVAEGEEGDVPVEDELEVEDGEGGEDGEEGEEDDDDAPDVEDMSSAVFDGHEGPVYSITASHSGALAASGDGEDTAFLWRVADGSLLHTLKGHTDTVIGVYFNRNDTLLATASMDGTVKVWEVASGALLRTLEGPSSEIEWAAWHAKGDVIVAGSSDFTVWMWDASNGKNMGVFAGHEASVSAGGFAASGKRIVTGVWPLACLHSLPVDMHSQSCLAFQYSGLIVGAFLQCIPCFFVFSIDSVPALLLLLSFVDDCTTLFLVSCFCAGMSLKL